MDVWLEDLRASHRERKYGSGVNLHSEAGAGRSGAAIAPALGMPQRCALLLVAAVAVTCSTCPDHSVLAEGGGSCQCDAGYSWGGASCVACAAGTYTLLPGNGTCSPCPDHSVLAEGGRGCQCNAGFTGDASTPRATDVTALSSTGLCPGFEHTGPGKPQTLHLNLTP